MFILIFVVNLFVRCNLQELNTVLISLDSKVSSTAATLARMEANLDNLQQRAHVWDTFQLHVAAWNDELASIDRKADIISKGQEKILQFMESEANSVASLGNKIDQVIEKLIKIEGGIGVLAKHYDKEILRKDYELLVGEFAAKGILSTVKQIEKKIDNFTIHDGIDGNGTKLMIQCRTPPSIEEFLSDISTKVDAIYDKLENAGENTEDYLDNGLTTTLSPVDTLNRKILKKINKRCKRILPQLDELLEKTSTIEKISQRVLDQQSEVETFIKNFSNKTDIVEKAGKNIFEKNSTRCGNLTKNDGLCIFRDDYFWAVIQRRENINFPYENFNLSWSEYKTGFGNQIGDFWAGNDLISALSSANNLILRIELDDFSGRRAWAEYHKFVVLPETEKYRLIIGRYKGNASDSFSSHNGSAFSTFDRKNDQAPECCPCAVSYGSGWWFNSCFESNLNGPFYNQGANNGFYGGIIWENWLGNYSLKKTIMMVRVKQETAVSTPWPYYEDP